MTKTTDLTFSNFVDVTRAFCRGFASGRGARWEVSEQTHIPLTTDTKFLCVGKIIMPDKKYIPVHLQMDPQVNHLCSDSNIPVRYPSGVIFKLTDSFHGSSSRETGREFDSFIKALDCKLKERFAQ